MFQISDKVVCVDDANQDTVGDTVKKDAIYVVRGDDGMNGPYLVGLCAGYLWGKERGWRPSRFRKLSDIKAENAAKAKREEESFTRMLEDFVSKQEAKQ